MPKLDIPPQVEEFLKQPNTAVMACIRPDGFPMTVVTWYDWEDGRILVNLHESRRRLGWMRANPKVSLTMFDDDWYRHVSIFGLVRTMLDDADLKDIDRLALRYTGHPFETRNAKRLSVWIEPIGWHGWDDSGALASRPRKT